MVCRLIGAKPLSEPMLEYCWLDHWELQFKNYTFSFKKMHLKMTSGNMSAILSQPQCGNDGRWPRHLQCTNCMIWITNNGFNHWNDCHLYFWVKTYSDQFAEKDINDTWFQYIIDRTKYIQPHNMSMTGFQHFIEKFSWKKCINELIGLKCLYKWMSINICAHFTISMISQNLSLFYDLIILSIT